MDLLSSYSAVLRKGSKNALVVTAMVLALVACGSPTGTTTSTTGGTPYVTGSCSAGPAAVDGAIFLENPRTASGSSLLSFTANLSSYTTAATVSGLDGTCLLQGDHFRVISDSLYPNSIAVATGGLNYTPSDPRFQQVMAFHYASTLRQRLASAGTDLSAMGMVSIDAHCNVSNNAYYSPGSKKLCFGYINAGAGKKVWAADDADVIAHEAGHAINHTVSSTTVLNSSGEAGAMDEAYADYWAFTVNTNSIISEWFLGALESIYSLSNIVRDASDNHSYPGSMVYELHDDSRVFSEALWDIRGSLGGAKTDKLVSTSLAMLPSTARFKDGVQALQDAANILGFTAAEKNSILNKLDAKGLVRADSAANLRLSADNSHNPVYVIDDHTLSSQSGGNCNGVLDVGETALVLVNVENPTGSSMGVGVVSLTGAPEGITIATGGGSGEFFRMKPGADFVDTLNSPGVYKEDATLAAAFLLTAATSGAKSFTMSFTPMGGAPVNINFALTVGSAATSSGCSDSSLWP